MTHRWTAVAGSAFFILLALVSSSFAVRAEGSAEVVSERALPDASLAEPVAVSERTISVALELDRDGARLLGFAIKNRPYDRAEDPAFLVQDARGPETAQIEIALIGDDGGRFTRRLEMRGLCLDHGPESDPHIEGDTIRLHRESVVVDLPQIVGYDHIEVARARDRVGSLVRQPLGTLSLGAPSLGVSEATAAAPGGSSVRAGGAQEEPIVWGDGSGGMSTLTPGTVHWPSEYGDPETTLLYGNLSEVSKRINIVIVPDGYTYAEKPLMKTHAQALVDAFRARTPYKEYDPFLNYILVYAYSTQSGTDQCDCGIVADTAMATRFPLQVATCLATENRCLFYGTGNGGPNCDPNTSTANIAAAELRAPARDATVVMVNTTRYGGCGGLRAVYSAGHASGPEIALHELGHSVAGLADEYTSSAGCGTSAQEVNTSLDGMKGSWPEWIGDLGAPRAGAQYYPSCVYRPETDCEMRFLNSQFCRVCKQQFSLTIFGYPNISPSAPISSQSPSASLSPQIGQSTNFSVATRLPVGAGVTNTMIWKVQGPGFPSPTVVATGAPMHTRAFATPGSYTMTCEVTAGTNFIKPLKTGPNRDTVTWQINALAVPEVSGAASPPLRVQKSGTRVTLTFANAGATRYNLYVSKTAGTAPFRVASSANGKKVCALSGVTSAGAGLLQAPNVDLDTGITGTKRILYFLVTADNGPATEGSLGKRTGGVERTADSYCAR